MSERNESRPLPTLALALRALDLQTVGLQALDSAGEKDSPLTSTIGWSGAGEQGSLVDVESMGDERVSGADAGAPGEGSG